MTIESARKLFPEETEGLSDEALREYCSSSEILSQIFIGMVEQKLIKNIDTNEKN